MKKFIPQNIVAHSIIIFILALFFATPSYAHTEEELLRKYVTNLINDGYKLFNNAKISKAERDKKSAQLLKDNLYLEWMAKYSLGRHRRTLTDDKINEFVLVYSKFVVKAYVDLTHHYNGEKARLKMVKQVDDDMFLVNMEILTPGSNSPIRVDYLVHQLENQKNQPFKVADIITEGISILNSQQAEFNNVISSQGIDALIADLEAKANRDAGALKKVRY